MLNGPGLAVVLAVAITYYVGAGVVSVVKHEAPKIKHGIVHVLTLGHK